MIIETVRIYINNLKGELAPPCRISNLNHRAWCCLAAEIANMKSGHRTDLTSGINTLGSTSIKEAAEIANLRKGSTGGRNVLGKSTYDIEGTSIKEAADKILEKFGKGSTEITTEGIMAHIRTEVETIINVLPPSLPRSHSHDCVYNPSPIQNLAVEVILSAISDIKSGKETDIYRCADAKKFIKSPDLIFWLQVCGIKDPDSIAAIIRAAM